MLSLCVLDVHVLAERARPVQRVHGHEVLEPIGSKLSDQLAHPRALELEHPGRVARSEHCVDRRFVQRDMVDVHLDSLLTEQHHRVVDDRQVPQAQEVHLQEPELLDTMHVELGDDATRVVS